MSASCAELPLENVVVWDAGILPIRKVMVFPSAEEPDGEMMNLLPKVPGSPIVPEERRV